MQKVKKSARPGWISRRAGEVSLPLPDISAGRGSQPAPAGYLGGPGKSKVASLRPTWAEIDLDAIAHNFKWLKEGLGPDTKVLAVVKANAYGHGLLEVSDKLIDCGVNFLGVATVDEAISLRQSGVKIPVLVLGGILPDEIEGIIKYDVTQTITDAQLAKEIDTRATRKKRKITVHAKIDTGMGRLGTWYENAIDFIKALKASKGLFLEGLFTHFSSADEGEKNISYTRWQIDSFLRLIEDLKRLKINIPFKHAANSMGTVLFKNSHLNLVRPGLMLYGLCPRYELAQDAKLKPAMSLKTKVIFLKTVPAGRHISYDRTYTTQRQTQIATIPIGYADGYTRALSNRAEVLIRGRRAPVIGNICMDHTMVDVGHISNVKVGDEVVLIGSQSNQRIRAEEVAGWAGTIPYEIVCCVSSRVPRKYL